MITEEQSEIGSSEMEDDAKVDYEFEMNYAYTVLPMGNYRKQAQSIFDSALSIQQIYLDLLLPPPLNF